MKRHQAEHWARMLQHYSRLGMLVATLGSSSLPLQAEPQAIPNAEAAGQDADGNADDAAANALVGSAKKSAASPDAPLADLAEPEEEIARMLAEVARLQAQISSVHRFTNQRQQRTNSPEAKLILARAERNFAQKRYLLAIANYQQYLKANQQLARGDYLGIQLKLGIAHEHTGNASLAFEACRNFITNFITADQKHYGELLDVVKRILRLEIHKLHVYQPSLRKVFTALMSLSVPPELRYEVVYYTARAAANAGMTELAAQWLANTSAHGATSALKARAWYFQGLMAASLGAWDKAEDYLSKAVYHEEKQPGELLPYARLARARVLSYRGKTSLALTAYEAVGSDSALGRQAHYEQVFLHFRKGNFKKARTLAAGFLSQYPDDALSKNLQPLMPYLNLRAGDHSLAVADLSASRQSLEELRATLAKRYRNLPLVQDASARELAAKVSDLVPPSPLLYEGVGLYAQRDDQAQELQQVDGQLNHFLSVLSRIELKSAYPSLYYRNKQVLRIGYQALALGHRMVATEKLLFDRALPETHRLRLGQYWKRRQALASSREVYYSAQRPMRHQSHFLMLSNRLIHTHMGLRKLKARLVGYRLRASKTALPFAASLDRDIKQASNLAVAYEGRLAALLNELRRARTLYGLEEFTQQHEKTFLNQYGIVLAEEMALLAPYLQQESGVIDHLLVADLVEVREKWEGLMKAIYADLQGVEGNVRRSVETILGRVDELQKLSLGKRAQLAAVSQATDQALTLGLDPILSHYESLVSERLARNLAWEADAKWIAYEKSAGEHAAAEARFQLDKEILDNHLYQLQNGVLWQWPR